MVPLLILLLTFDPREATATSLAAITVIVLFVGGGFGASWWWALPFLAAGFTSVTAWNSAARAQGEIALGAPYRWNSRLQLGYTLGRAVGLVVVLVIVAMLLWAVTMMLLGRLKL